MNLPPNVGKFKISYKAICESWSVLAKTLFSEIVPIAANYDITRGEFEYIGISNLFEPVDLATQNIPYYTIDIETTHQDGVLLARIRSITKSNE